MEFTSVVFGNMLEYPRDDTHAKGRKLVKKCAK